MYKPIKFIAEVPNINFSTFYLFCKQLNILIPIEISDYSKSLTACPSVYDSIKRIIYGTGYSVDALKIYRYEYNTYYSYITIKKGNDRRDINISLKDGLNITKETMSPIYIDNNILKTSGILINKDMILEALEKTA